MAAATNLRRDLYASSEPRPKDSAKKRNGSPPKRSSHKSIMKKPKKELSPEEYSTLAYQSISLLLQAARTLDEAEKRARAASKPKTKGGRPTKPPPTRRIVKKKKKESKQLTPTTVTQVVSPAIPTAPTEIAPSRSPVRPKIEEAPSTSSQIPMSTLSILTDAVSPSHEIHRPLPTYRSVLEHHYSLPPKESPLPAPKAIYGIPSPVSCSPRETPLPAPKPIYGIPSPVSSLSSLAPFNPTSIMVPEVTSSVVPLLSPILRPTALPAPPESLLPSYGSRLLSSMAIPPEFADIAVPVAPRSVTAVPKATPKPMKLPRLPRGPNQHKRWAAQVALEQQKAANFGHLDECRTRIPDAVRRYWERLDRKKDNEGNNVGIYSNFYW